MTSISVFSALLALCSALASAGTSCTLEEMARENLQKLALANNELAFNLHRKLTSGSSENLFFSPFSISSAFAMVLYGAKGNTEQELREALGNKKADILNDLVHDTFNLFLSEVLKCENPSDDYVLNTTNAVLSDKHLELLEEYRNDGQELYKVDVRDVDFITEAPKVVHEINAWVKEKTNAKIEKLFDELSPFTVLVLLNAVYFTGTWKTQFERKLTRDQDFYNNGLESAGKFYFLILLLIPNIAITQTTGNATSNCGQKEKTMSYLDVAADMIAKAKTHYATCTTVIQHSTPKPVDCEEALRNGGGKSGVYTIWPRSRVTEDKSLVVYCDMDTDGGGWTVIQRRGDFKRPNDYFYQDYASYKKGFGDIEKDFWLGNDNIYALSNQRLYSIRFDLKAVDGEKRYALYDSFWIDDDDHKFKLHIKDYSGDAGDSMKVHDNVKFSTKDQENDVSPYDGNCALLYKGAWWYKQCHHSNLNGLYLKGPHKSFADGINWSSWRGFQESLDTTEMKIRPKNFGKNSDETTM